MTKTLQRIVMLICLGLAPYALQAQETDFLSYETPENAEEDGFVAHEQFTAAPFAKGDVSRFMFDGWTGPAIPVWTYVPSGADVEQAPIMFMMHGAKRNPARYLLEWVPHAQQHGFIVVAPEFSRRDFRGSRRYNRGNVSRHSDGEYFAVDESEWSFSAIEPLFDHTLNVLESRQVGYTLYGHSAGSQFAHRFMFHKPRARVKRILAANAGWYTMPDPEIDYPYGLKDSGVSKETLKLILHKSVLILLGDQDIDTRSSSLKRSEGAMLQGEHRFNRGITFMETAMEQAERLQVTLGWRIQRVEGVGHSNSGMAEAAAPHVR